MIKEILDLLAIDEHFAQSEIIEIAKGKNQIPKTFKKAIKQIKREWKIR